MSFYALEFGQIIIGNNHSCGITRIHSIRYKLDDDVVGYLEDVRCIPSMKKNLISFGILEAYGYKLDTKFGILEVISKTLVVMKPQYVLLKWEYND